MSGKPVTNPMLAFGPGPEGRTCDQCKLFDIYDAVCRKRSPHNATRRQVKKHHGSWPACKYFDGPIHRGAF